MGKTGEYMNLNKETPSQSKTSRRIISHALLTQLLMLSVCVGTSLCWDLTSKSQMLRKEEALTDNPINFEFRIPVFKTVYISLYGYGNAQIQYTDPRTNQEKSLVCSSPSHILCPLWNFSDGENGWNTETITGNFPLAPINTGTSQPSINDPQYPINIKVKLISTVWQQGSPDYNRSVKFEMIGSQFVEINYGDHSHFYLSPDSQNIDIRMNMQNSVIPPGAEDTTSTLPVEHKLRKFGNLKFQIFAFQGNQFWINLNQHFKLYLKQGADFASKESHQAGGNSTMGLGIVKTLIAKDEEFCVTPECFYAVRIECENVSAFLYTSTLFNKVAVQNVWDFATLLDEIRENDDYAVYDINSVDGGGKNWQWNLLPVFGNPDTYIQGDKLPERLEDFHLSSDKDSTESIVVTTLEAQTLQWSNSRYFQKVVAHERTAFVTFIKRTYPGSPQYLEPNVPVSGEAAENEMVVYNFGINIFTPETVTAFVDLKALTGDPDLYIKECSDFQNICTFNEEDVSNREALAVNSSKYFKYSAEKNSGDALYIKVNCLPQSNFIPSQNNSPPQTQGFDFKNKLFTSSTCKFAIGVRGGTSEVHSMSKYQLVVKGFRHHEVLTLDMPRGYSFRLGTNDEKFFMLNVDQSYTTKTEHNKVYKKTLISVRFDFTFLSGDCKVTFSRTNPFPEESEDILYGDNQSVAKDGRGILNFDNNEKDLQGVSKSMIFKLRQSPSETYLEEKLTGHFYVGIKTSELVFGEVRVLAEYEMKEGEGPDLLQAKLVPLYLKQQQIGKIKVTTPQIPDFFQFDLELEGTKEIGLSFQPVQGQFSICLVMYNVYYADNLLEWSNTTLPCLIESLNAPILISKQNSKLKYINPNEGQNHYRFMVKVEPIVLGPNPNPPLSSSETSDKNIPKEYLYTITLTLNTLHTEILLGSRYDFSNTDNKEMLFDAIIPRNSDGFLVLLEGSDNGEMIAATLNQDNKLVVGQNSSEVKQRWYSEGNAFLYLIFTKKDLEERCDETKYKKAINPEDEPGNSSQNAAQKQDDSKTIFQCKVYIRAEFLPRIVVHKYSLIVNTFERPFMMNWGELKIFPAPFKRPILASVNIHASDLIQHGATINTYCRKYTLQLSVEVYFRKKFMDQKSGKQLVREVKRTFVSVENLSNLIHVPGQEFRDWDDAEFRIMVNNVDAQKQLSKTQVQEQFSDYELGQNLLIQVSSALTKLKDAISIPDLIQEGVFKYYYFTKFAKESAIISLNVIDSGEADLYVSKNSDYPSLEKYSFKSDSFKNDQVEIPASTGSHDEQDEEQQFIVGVYAKKNTKYEIVLDMNSSLKLLPAAAGKVFSRQNIRKGDSLLITYENKELGDFELAFYTSKSRVSIYFAPWDEELQPYFKNAIPQESTQLLLAQTKILGQTQRVTIRQTSAKNITWLFKVVIDQTDNDTIFEYLIDNLKDPLQLKGDKIFKDSLVGGTFKVYEFYSDFGVDQANLRITLDYGTINLVTNSRSIPSKGEHDNIQQLKSDGSNSSSLTFQMKSGSEKNNNLGLFKSYYFAIDVSKNSSFRIEINRDGRIFETLIPGIKLPYLWSSKEKRNLYYRINSIQGLRSFKLIFHSSTSQFRAKRNHFRRYLSDEIKGQSRQLRSDDNSYSLTATDVVNHFEFFTLNTLDLDTVRQTNPVDSKGQSLKKITATVLDSHTVENDGRISYIFNLAVNAGTFIVAPRWDTVAGSSEGEYELKLEIELVVNGLRNVNANSWVQGFLSNADENQGKKNSHHLENQVPKNPKLQDEALYQVIVPSSGTLEVKIEKCSGFMNIFAKQNGDVAELGIDLDHPENIQASSTDKEGVVQQLMENMEGFDKKYTLKYKDAGTFLIDLGLPKIANKGVTKQQLNENNASKGSSYVIRTRFAPQDSQFIWPEAFFFQDAYNPEFKDFTIDVSNGKFKIQAKRIQPSEELESHFKDIASAKVIYKAYVIQAPVVSVHSTIDNYLSQKLKDILKENQSEREKIFHFNVCNPAEEFSAKSIPYSVSQSEYSVDRDEKGLLKWTGSKDRILGTSTPDLIEIEAPTPIGSHPPYYLVLNVQINLLGDYNDEIGDDIIIRGHSVRLIEALPSNTLRIIIFCFIVLIFLSASLIAWKPSRSKIFTLFGFNSDNSFQTYDPQNTNIEMSAFGSTASTSHSQDDDSSSPQSTNFRSNRIETTANDDDLSLRSQGKQMQEVGANDEEDEQGDEVYGIE